MMTFISCTNAGDSSNFVIAAVKLNGQHMNTKARKVMIIGAGNVGASAAYALLNQNICEELILVDLNRDRAEGHAQDLADAAAYMPGMMSISTRDARDCADVDIAVITVSGGALKPGQTRLDELTNTARIVKGLVPQMMENGFNGIFLIATNPCDIITWQVWTLSGLPRSQVIGTGVWLDTTRLRRTLAQALDIGALLFSASTATPSSRFGRTPRFTARRSAKSISATPVKRLTVSSSQRRFAVRVSISITAKAAPNTALPERLLRFAAIFSPAVTARWRFPACWRGNMEWRG
jgi:hypothetical protein